MNRRQFLRYAGVSTGLGLSSVHPPRVVAANPRDASAANPFFKTRGVVLVTKDLREVGWPRIAKEAGLSTIGTHITPREVAEFVRSEQGQQFLDQCQEFGIEVEHELHAMRDLLPRSLFAKHPEMFRMDKDGNRVPDYNCCVHCKQGLEVICQNAVQYGRLLRPTTGRYFYWMDDVKPMCKCAKCRVYSDSDQALIVENALIKALRNEHSHASLAHLCYVGTIEPPQQVKPSPGVFLEFAPIERSWAHPLKEREVVGRSNA